MATLVKMQQVLEELESENAEATLKRRKSIKARIALRNIEIDKLVELTGCRRRVLERKHGGWIRSRTDSVEADIAKYGNARMLANASNATRQLKSWK